MVNESLISVCKPVHSLLPGFLIAMHMCADTVLKMMLRTHGNSTLYRHTVEYSDL